jgi:DNA-binding LacI/PurR family transcriptional regulator
MTTHRQMPSLAEVARLAGVSASSASRILNDSPGFRASEAVRQRVKEIALRLGYRPDPLGRALRMQRTNVVGILGLWTDILTESQAISRAIASASTTLYEAGYDVVASLPRPGRPRFQPSTSQFDGALLLIPGEHEPIEAIDALGTPYVSLDGPALGNGVSFRFDDQAATAIIVRHLLAQGHRKIAWWQSIVFDHHSVADRATAFHRVMAEAGATACPVPAGCDPMGCLSACRTTGATAVLAYGAMWAVRLLQTARAEGLSIPRDLALATFNDDASTHELGITTIAWPTVELGSEAARVLVGRMQGQPADRAPRIMQGQLRVRNSA